MEIVAWNISRYRRHSLDQKTSLCHAYLAYVRCYQVLSMTNLIDVPAAAAIGSKEAERGISRIRVTVLPDGTLNRREAAKYLGRSSATLESWANQRIGPPYQTCMGRVFYRLVDLERFRNGQSSDDTQKRGKST